MSGQVDVRSVLMATCKGLHSVANGCSRSDLSTPMRERAEELDAATAAVAQLIAADHEYNAALTALKDLNQHIADKGWMEVEFDALRKAGDRFVKATIDRDHALAGVGGAA